MTMGETKNQVVEGQRKSKSNYQAMIKIILKLFFKKRQFTPKHVYTQAHRDVGFFGGCECQMRNKYTHKK